MPKPQRVRVSSRHDARERLRVGVAYLEVAGLVLREDQQDEFFNVAAGLAVLAGIAASDAICAASLQQIHRGEDHRGAADLLKQVVPDGSKLRTTFLRLIDMKDEAHYGVVVVAPTRARSAVKWAQHLVDRAQAEVAR